MKEYRVGLLPEAQAIVDRMAKLFPQPGPGTDARVLRSRFKEAAASAPPVDPEPVGSVQNRMIPGGAGNIAVRVYRSLSSHEGELIPVVVFFHGGGWILGDLDSHDGLCRSIGNLSGCCIVAVDYGLAPEHHYPAASDDAYAALTWVAAEGKRLHIDVERIAVMGDSAGGNLAAAVTQMARDRGGPRIARQVLIAPALDYRFDTPSHLGQGEGRGTTSNAVRYYWDQYLANPAQGEEPYAAPSRAASLAGLPPVLLVLASHDPLRSEAVAYAERLAQAGVNSCVSIYAGMAHGFWAYKNVLRAANDAHEQIGAWLHQWSQSKSAKT